MRCFGRKTLNGGPRGRSLRLWKDNMKMDLKEIQVESVNWIVPAVACCKHDNQLRIQVYTAFGLFLLVV